MDFTNIIKEINWNKITNNQLIIVDLETTGFDEKEDVILEIGAVKLAKGMSKPEEFSRLIKTDKIISAEITELTGITNQLIDDEGVPFYKAIGDFKEFLGTNDFSTYNAAFDSKFLKAITKKYNIPFSPYASCTMLLCRKAFSLKGSKLSDVAEHLNIKNPKAHRAIPDCLTTLKCHLHALKALDT